MNEKPESTSVSTPPFSVALIGNSSLCIQCAQLLSDNQHPIMGIATSDPAVERWAAEANIPCLFFAEADGIENERLAEFFEQRPFDYLFSIDNAVILPDSILSLPNALAINYHDAPLPRYGGLNATTWAIHNQEKTHGVTWHVAASKVDAGDILKQHLVELSDHETALALNAKCYEAAISAFHELMGDLAAGTLTREPQETQNRSFYFGHQRPTPGCIITWDQPADDLIAMVRSLSFDSYLNPLGIPKIAFKDQVALISQVEKLETQSAAEPGTLLAIQADEITIATADFDVVLSRFQDHSGRACSAAFITERWGLTQGDCLPKLAPAVAQQITAFTKTIHKHEPYWVSRLSSITPLKLPYVDTVLSPATDGPIECISLEIPPTITSHHQKYIHDQSLGDFLASMAAIYLARLSGETTFDIGFQSAELHARLSDGEMSHLFAPHVPFRIDLDNAQAVETAGAILKKQIDSSCARHTFTADLTARYPELRAMGDSGQLFSVLIEMCSADRLEHSPSTQNNADLILQLPEAADEDGRAEMSWLYRPGRIAAENIGRMQQQFLTLLEHAIENPAEPISTLPILTPAETDQILVDWNPTFGPYPQGEFFHNLVEAQAKRVPNHTAVVYEDQRLTYQELDARASHLAQQLSQMGVGPETLVGLLVERSPDMMVAILGILKAGGAYVPMNTADPDERLAFIVEDTALTVLVTQESLIGRLPTSDLKTICLDPGWYDPDFESVDRFDHGLTIDNLAYVIYTSGSTGRPKGVMMSHRSLVSRFYWEMDEFGRDETDVVLQQFSISFDYSVWEIFVALTTGASLVMTKPHGHTDRAYLTRLIKEQGITITGFVPAMLESILDETELATIASLRQVATGGEELTVELQTKYFDRMSAELLNGYGPTEACIDATYWVCTPTFEHPRIPIGRPLANSRVYLLDDNLQLVPPGVPGEMCIGGIGLARGYLNRPDLTAEKFVPDPFYPEPGERLYLTGDLAYHLPDGNIVFVGRKDNQIQLRGHRVELSEIQLALEKHPAVQRSVVVAHGDTHQTKQLVAYIKPHDGAQLTNQALRRSLTSLPDYMLPSSIILVDAFPLTNNGKIDTAQLPAPTRGNRLTDEATVRPHTEDEAIIAAIWEEVLEIDAVGIHDNYFALGGNSLMITQIASRLREQLHFDLPIHELFEAPTVAQLALKKASLIDQQSERDQQDSLAFNSAFQIKPAERGSTAPLSFAQQGLWFLDQLETDNIAYNIPQAYRLKGQLNIGAFQKSLTEVVARHEILRTTFELHGSEPVQVIQPASPFKLQLVDLTGDHEPAQTAAALIQQTNERPFDLANDLMLRACVYQLGNNDYILALFTHHIAYDGWSDAVMWQELTALYTAFCTGATAELPNLPIQYADYSFWQREQHADAHIGEHLDFWREQLSDLETLQLPTDYTRPPRLTYHGRAVPFKLSKQVTAQLKQITQRHNGTLFMTLLSAFKLLLSRYSGQSDIVVGTSIANRTLSEIEPLVGFFINTLVVRSKLDQDSSFETLLQQVRQTLLASYPHQTLPFERIVEEIQPTRDLSQNPIFQVLFVLQNTKQNRFELPDLEQSFWPLEHKSIHIDLECEFYEHEGELVGEFVYNTALFSQQTVEQMVNHYINLLELIGTGDDRPISQIPLLSSQEEHQILTGWNETAVPLPDQSLSELFAAQAAQSPDQTAIIYGDETVSYREVAQRTNQLAVTMQARGIQAGDRVGVALERSPNVTYALLAILQLGATYVPLDPAYPAERLQWMADDAQLSLLVTNEQYAPLFDNTHQWLLCMDGVKWDAPSDKKPGFAHRPQGDAPAYILYTSGSTGRPKGVVGCERGILNRMNWMWRTYPFKAGDVGCLKTSLC